VGASQGRECGDRAEASSGAPSRRKRGDLEQRKHRGSLGVEATAESSVAWRWLVERGACGGGQQQVQKPLRWPVGVLEQPRVGPAMECGRARPRGARSDLALLYIPCCRAGVRGIRPAALQYGCLVSVNLVAIPYPLVCTFVSLLHSFSFSEMSDK